MTLVKVETKQTTYTEFDFVKATIEAWQEMYKETPKKETVYILLAQTAHETAFGKACWNWNLFNVKAKDVVGSTIEYVALNGVWEIVNGKKVILTPENPGSWFRAFPSLKEGIKHHFKFLNNSRYSSAFAACKAGNLEDFCNKLHDAGYYTDSVKNYFGGTSRYYKQFFNSGSYEKILSQHQNDIENNWFDNVKHEVVYHDQVKSNIVFEREEKEPSDSSLTLNNWQKILSFIFNLLSLIFKRKN